MSLFLCIKNKMKVLFLHLSSLFESRASNLDKKQDQILDFGADVIYSGYRRALYLVEGTYASLNKPSSTVWFVSKFEVWVEEKYLC